MKHEENKKHYIRLLVMSVLSFISMYVFMFAMVDTFSNVIPNYNQFYMAGLMTAPMIIIEVFLMKAMYQNKKLNIVVISGSFILLIVFFLFIRKQTAISDEQFLKSMIPHHASALLMCEESEIQDPEIRELCKNIKTSQQAEIDQMKEILRRLDK